MKATSLQEIIFLVILVCALSLGLWILKPFFDIVILAVIVAILLHPVQAWIERKSRVNTSTSALLVVLSLIAIIATASWVFGSAIFDEVSGLVGKVLGSDNEKVNSVLVTHVPAEVQHIFGDISLKLDSIFNKYSSEITNFAANLLSNAASFLYSFGLFLFSLYYLLRDGSSIRQFLKDISPLPSSKEDVLIEGIKHAVNGVVKGTLFISLCQGLLATLGFVIFGVPSPFLWGSLVILASFIPVFGTSLIMLPAVLFLFLSGHITSAILLAVWAALLVGTIDNFLSPRVISKKTAIHPLFVLLSVLGGLQVFGPFGFLFGPLLMSICITLLKMYQQDFKGYLSEKASE